MTPPEFLEYFANNLNTPPCAGDPCRVAMRHEIQLALAYPTAQLVQQVKNPPYGYTNGLDYLVRYLGWDRGLTAAELDAAVVRLQTQFNETRTLTLPASTNSGFIVNRPTGSSYIRGSRVSLKAVPHQGCVFRRWTGNVPAGQETANPLVFFLNTNAAIQAEFTRPPGTLDLTREKNGEVTLRFVASSNRSHTVQYTGGLSPSVWCVITNLPAQPETTEVIIKDPTAKAIARRFYRVAILQ